MADAGPRGYRAGAAIEDYCRACKMDRMHTVVAVDAGGRPLRVSCGYCRSEHNYRGGPRLDRPVAPPPRQTPAVAAEALPSVTDRERSASPVELNHADLELLLRRIIREESGLTAVAPAA